MTSELELRAETEFNPFPYFTNFWRKFGISVAYSLISEEEKVEEAWIRELVQSSTYTVSLIDGRLKKFVGTIETRLAGSPSEDDHFYHKRVIYRGKLPTEKGLTRFDRKIVYEEQPETMTADRPVRTEVRQSRFYKNEFPSWIFDYVVSPEHKIER